MKMMEGSEMETAGVMGKSKETADLEAETVVGTECGVDTEVGMHSKLTADWSRVVVGAEASVGSTITTAGGDVGADMQLTVVGTATEVNAVVVARLQVGPIAETILFACAAASEFTAAANAGLRIAGTEMEQVG